MAAHSRRDEIAPLVRPHTVKFMNKNNIGITCSLIVIVCSIILILLHSIISSKVDLATLFSHGGLLVFGVFLLVVNLRSRKK